ncbi:HAD-IIA family hydrolase [Propioniciclava soli]|uniref:HAD-IIA family hydrolase n=1 Tax=Propioniciclava soli TaxID=2775081 RepID=A0ABZ3CDF9_9ACTN|nr:HAD-IIA family hydrolase [Propioniciclava soli]
MRDPKNLACWLTDKDGVLVHGDTAIPGAKELIDHWTRHDTPYLVLTNDSIQTPRDLAARLHRAGLEVPEENIWTSAMATAAFLANQNGDKTAYVLGEAGLTTALHEAGFVLTDLDPEFVVLGETRGMSFEQATRAIRLILGGARFIVTNPDVSGPGNGGIVPATGAFAAMITAATGRKPYIVGKPNPMMFRSALNQIQAHSESTGMIGDTMSTDIVAGMEAGLHTVLVLTGSTRAAELESFPYRPSRVLDSVADLLPLLTDAP